MKTLFYIVAAVGAAALLFVLAVLNVIDIKITLTSNRRE